MALSDADVAGGADVLADDFFELPQPAAARATAASSAMTRARFTRAEG
jgi:hypothetical protein